MLKLNILKELKAFLILWSSQAVSTLGTAMTNYALIIWVYTQKETATSLTTLSICSFLPSILFSFIAGTIADKWDKKRIMLFTDCAAALGTLTVFLLYATSSLEIWHLYIINFVLSFMNAFQNPASYVATSLLVPKRHYVRASGLQAFSGSIITILAPALGGALMTFGGLHLILILDLASFAFAFLILLFVIKIPSMEEGKKEAAKVKESFVRSCLSGLHFLREHTALLKIILFFAFINLIAKMGSYGMLPVLVLSRTKDSQSVLGMVQAAVGIGTLVGSVCVTLMKPAKRRTAVAFFACGISFILGDVGQSITHSLPFWMLAGFASNIPMAFLNANLTAIMRTNVPIDMQGRVFSTRDTIQYSTIPVGLFLGGLLSDYVFEPFMRMQSPITHFLSSIFGTGKGSGTAIIFFIVGMLGFVSSMLCLRNPRYRTLD